MALPHDAPSPSPQAVITLPELVEQGVLPPDLTEELARHEGATECFESFPPSVRAAILRWIAVAKAPTTRARRIEATAVKAAHGEPAHP
ncbi:MAG: YdeI/OmpD-associated family protein [Glaciihabitans sp.]